MQVKVFEADDMKTALRQVREVLGPDALILSTRTLSRGGLGRLGRPRLEVTAAVEPKPSAPAAAAVAPPKPPAARSAATDDLSYEEIWQRRPAPDPLKEEVRALKGQLASLDLGVLRSEIRELKQMVRLAPPRAERAAPAPPEPAAGGWLPALTGLLSERGLEAEVVERIVRLALAKLSPRQKQDPAALRAFCRQAIAHLVKVGGPLAGSGRAPRQVALVGPTGVGKTTTIAKLAAEFLARRQGGVALVTIDIYRIAAAEQLKVYGEIMNLPVDVVTSPAQLRQVLARHRDKELVLIDTAGRSPADARGLEELAAFLGGKTGIENHLVLSAATRERELGAAVRQFGRIPLHRLIFTKLDECETLGSILNVQHRCNRPLSYLTNGQRVPEDLLLADPGQVAKLIMGAR